jgi:hypothetical protein
MAELQTPEQSLTSRLSALHLPEMRRDDIVRILGEWTREVDLSQFDPRRPKTPTGWRRLDPRRLTGRRSGGRSISLPPVDVSSISLPRLRMRRIEMPVSIEVPRIGVVELPRVELPRVELPKVELTGIERPQVEIPRIEINKEDLATAAAVASQAARLLPASHKARVALALGGGIVAVGVVTAVIVAQPPVRSRLVRLGRKARSLRSGTAIAIDTSAETSATVDAGAIDPTSGPVADAIGELAGTSVETVIDAATDAATSVAEPIRLPVIRVDGARTDDADGSARGEVKTSA